MPDDLTPAQARRAINNLADEYEPNRLYGVASGQNDPSAIPDVDDRQTLLAVADVLNDEEIHRRVYDGDEPPRGVEETPAGAAAVDDAARSYREVNYPVTMDVEVVGEPGDREIEIVPERPDGPGVDELEDALEKNFPSERKQDDPVNEFIEAVVNDVARAFSRELDDVGFAGRVGSVRVRSDGSYTFAPGEDPAEAFEQSQQMTPRERAEFEGRGTTRPTTQRSERGQQTLSEAGTRESLTEFAEGTVEDDPDEVIGPAEEARRQHRTAGPGAERTRPATEGLGRFERFDAVVKFTVGRGGSDHGVFVAPPDGRVIDMALKQNVESAVAEAADGDTMADVHGTATTVTVGTARFDDGGGHFVGFDFNDNWHGSQPRV